MPARKNTSSAKTLVTALAHWYAGERDRYEFRHNRNPYRTWITEIFMQQTQINAGREKLKTFLKRFPDVKALAAGPVEDVLAAFRGMGYYSRARNMFRAAQYVIASHKGVMPVSYAELTKVPGIGHYTAAIIASIHNDEAVLANDANHARVLSRLYAITHAQGTPAFAARAHELAAPLFKAGMAPGDLNEAIMQWGQDICRKNPRCEACFAREHCAAYAEKAQQAYPVKKPRVQAYDVEWTMLVCRRGNKYQVFEAGRSFPFLRGELMFPGFVVLPPNNKEAAAPEKLPTALRRKIGKVAAALPVDFRHAITRYKIAVKLVIVSDGIAGGEFFTPAELKARCHSSLMQKALSRLDKLEF
ncbi:MAG: A/G-specific adenine glycosylase [Spirochaetota bacterium]